VNDGRSRPIHAQFRDYLQWAFTKIPNHVASLVEEQVVEVRRYNNVHWEVSSSDGTTTRQRNPYDGVVLTGPGPARKLAVKGPPDKLRVFDGQDFWSRKPDVKRQLEAMLAPGRTLADSERIVIVGAGGTAAAILGWLVENGARTLPIEVIAGSQAALHMRSENPFENRLFTDSTAWMKLKPETRRAFTGRLNRGVVWEAVLDRISHLRSISILEGTAEQYEVLADGTLGVDYKTFDDSVPLPTSGPSPVTLTTTAASLVVDASGFDDMKWLDLFTMNPKDRQAYRKQLEDDLDDRLQLRGSPWNSRPPVHAPMLSSLVGPGYASLMSLGGMAERVLSRYGA
jgi:mycobactin lysine-N-oxygenase